MTWLEFGIALYFDAWILLGVYLCRLAWLTGYRGQTADDADYLTAGMRRARRFLGGLVAGGRPGG